MQSVGIVLFWAKKGELWVSTIPPLFLLNKATVEESIAAKAPRFDQALSAVFGANGGTAGMPVWQLGVGV
jgi:hypothetical protein